MDFLRYISSASKSGIDVLLGRLYKPMNPLLNNDIQGKRALVTGGNTGIGKEIALALARHGAEVFLLCRDAQKAEEARQDIIRDSGNTQVYVEALDLSLTTNIREFVAKWHEREKNVRPIDILINNAGLLSGTKDINSEGFELTYAVNALGCFTLAIDLLQRGCLAPDARIIQVSSVAIYWGYILAQPSSNLNSDDLLGSKEEGQLLSPREMILVYCRSKALQVAFTMELQSRLICHKCWSGVTVHAYHPGIVWSSVWDRKTGFAQHSLSALVSNLVVHALGIPTNQGAATGVWLATSPEASTPELRGKFWDRRNWRWAPAWIMDDRRRKAVWDIMALNSGLTIDI